MSQETYLFIKLSCGALATVGLYSVLYKETKVYRFVEHIFLGLAAGYSIVALWKDTLYENWWLKMMGTAANGTPNTPEYEAAIPGFWIYMFLLPIGLMGYMVFSKKNNWMSRIPIGMILGFWSGQQLLNWWTKFGPQIFDTINKPVIPTSSGEFFQPAAVQLDASGAVVAKSADTLAQINSTVYFSQALSNLIFVVTVIAALSYFIFSYELKGKFMVGLNSLGRWMLMIGFGAIFGATVMARFALVIDRMSFIWQEWGQTTMQYFGGG